MDLPKTIDGFRLHSPNFLNIKIGISQLIKKFEKALSVKPYIDSTLLLEKGMLVCPGLHLEIKEPMTLGKDICTPQSIQFNNYL